jgi:PAS domain S-box-containing protein
MSVRTKSILAIGIVLTFVLGTLFMGARALLHERFWTMEQARARAQSDRAIAELVNALEGLDTLCRTIAALPADWNAQDARAADARHALLAGGDQWFGVFDAQGALQVSGVSSTDSSAAENFNTGLHDYLTREGLVGPGAGRHGGRGALLLNGQPMLASVRPLASVPGGFFVLTRPMPHHESFDPSERLWISAAGAAGNLAGLGPETRESPAEVAHNGSTIAIEHSFADLGGRTRLHAVYLGRPLGFEIGRDVTLTIGVSLVLGVAMCTALAMLLLNRLVLGRLARLSAQLEQVGRAERTRVDPTGDDEVGQVVRTVNHTLAALDASREQLAHSEATFRSMVDNAPLGVFLTDAHGKAAFHNAQCTQMLGWPVTEMMNLDWEKAIHPADRERIMTAWKHAVATRTPYRQHHRIIRPDGSIRWTTANAAPIFENSEVRGFVGTIEDTTERLQAAEDLRRAKLAAEAASRAKSEFLANMSHEIRTPMTAILGFCDLLLSPDQTDADRRGCVETVRRNGEHLLAVINDILDLSKIESGEAAAERIACNPAQVICEVARTLSLRAQEKNLRLEVEFDGPLPTTLTNDPTKLRQVLINLVGNAVKFTEQGSIRVRARMTGPEDGARRLVVDIIDTGIGMTDEQIGRIFTPFSQGDGSMARRFGGTGLGLSISQKLAALMGGGVAVTSAPGEGSTFTVTIDAGEVRGPWLTEPPALAPVDAAGPGPVGSLSCRVLLAEDGPDNRRLLSYLLTRAGAEVVVVDNGRRAVTAALDAARAGSPFDIVLMDMQMPEVDGYTASRTLRTSGYQGVIIALTAHAMADDRQKCLDAGCSDYAAKPIDRATLIRKCAQWLRPRAAA